MRVNMRGGSQTERSPKYEPLHDTDARTGATIEVFYSDQALARCFGTRGAGWFWWSCRPSPPTGQRTARTVSYELSGLSGRVGRQRETTTAALAGCNRDSAARSRAAWSRDNECQNNHALLPYCFHNKRTWKRPFVLNEKF